MLKVGLTGGIASGKSAVSDRFRALGAPVIDTDVIARELVAPGSDALEEIVAVFGRDVLQADGALDRGRLRARVFADSAQRARLNAILHPRIKQAVQQRLATLDAPYCIIIVPLLVEAGFTDLVDRVLVVAAPDRLRRARLQQRDGLDDRAIDQAFAAQADDATRLAAADDVIHNTGTLADLDQAVVALHQRYEELGAN